MNCLKLPVTPPSPLSPMKAKNPNITRKSPNSFQNKTPVSPKQISKPKTNSPASLQSQIKFPPVKIKSSSPAQEVKRNKSQPDMRTPPILTNSVNNCQKVGKVVSSSLNISKNPHKPEILSGSLPNLSSASKPTKYLKALPKIANYLTKENQDSSLTKEDLFCPILRKVKLSGELKHRYILQSDVKAFMTMMGFFDSLQFLVFLKGIKACLKERIEKVEKEFHVLNDDWLEYYFWQERRFFLPLRDKADTQNWILELNKILPPGRKVCFPLFFFEFTKNF